MCGSRFVAFLGWLLMGLVVASAPIYAEPLVDLTTINKQLWRFPLKDEGPNFLKWGADYQVDPRLIVAIAGAETTYGKKENLCGDFNAWNWFWAGSCALSDFASFEQGIKTVSKFMRKSYFLAGYNTIEQIQTKYCASGCEHWAPNVTMFYRDEMGGDPKILTYSHPYSPKIDLKTDSKIEPKTGPKNEIEPKPSDNPSWSSQHEIALLVILFSLGAGAIAVALFFLIRRG